MLRCAPKPALCTVFVGLRSIREPPTPNNNHKTNNQPVILSGGQSPKSKFCGLSASEQAKPRCVAPQGYGNEFGWLTTVNVTFPWESHRDFEPYPASTKRSRAFPSLFAQKKFDYKIARDFSAQNDMLIVCFVGCVCFRASPRRPAILKFYQTKK